MVPLPLSPLPQGRISPPQGDAIPAPLARYATRAHADAARHLVSAMLQRQWVEGSYAAHAFDLEEPIETVCPGHTQIERDSPDSPSSLSLAGST